MFSSYGQASSNNKATAYPVTDARKDEQQEEKKLSFELRPFMGEPKEYHKQGSLVEDQGQIGYLKERYRDGAEFQRLDLPFAQRSKISRYVKVRDFYHELYNHETKHLEVHESLRSNLNLVYDNFVRRFGNLNDKKNLDVIKMDAGGTEILSLEHGIDGKLQKADDRLAGLGNPEGSQRALNMLFALRII